MPKQVPYLNIFLSSPGDVAEERAIARKIMKRLPNRPTFKGRVALNIIAWDDLDSATAMEASLTPQAAINKGLPTPAESDIVIVIFWSRMGTPFTDDTDGKLYESGTHWELLNALSSKRTKTYIYRRMQKVSLDPDAADFHSRYEQYQRVKDFFNSEMFYKDGQIKMSVQQYDSPADFEEMLDRNFEQMINEVLAAIETATDDAPQVKVVPTDKPEIQQAKSEAWDESRSPFPGLQAFTEDDADIFFGRGRETDALVQQVKNSRFVAVVGASGSGKSSLVGAGLVPRLRENAIVGSKDWHIVRFAPGKGATPFEALASALIETIPSMAFTGNPFDYPDYLSKAAQRLQSSADALIKTLDFALKNAPEWTQVLLFIDQFEELFTLAMVEHVQAFAEMLNAVAKSDRIRAVVTIRHDFMPKAVENQIFSELFRNGFFSLSIPKRDALRMMIERPAERAGIVFDEALIDRILNDTGDEPGNLALMAYALDELYKLDDDKHLTHAEYDALGGVQGAIGTRAENQFKVLNMDDSVIQQVFHGLVEVDERGIATRRREQFQADAIAENVRDLIYAFTDARLLTTSYDDKSKTSTVEVAHEAILRQWKRLADWIEATQDDQRSISRMKREALIWDERNRPAFLLPNAETLKEFQQACERLKVNINDAVLRDFTEPEQERLYRELEALPKDATSHERRRDIGDRLAVIGDTREGVGLRDNGLPDIAWIPIAEGGEITIETGGSRFGGGDKKSTTFEVKPFYIAKYLVTYAQYQVFAESDYDNPKWWEGFPDSYRPQKLSGARTKIANAPRDSISWYQAVAFSRWLDAQLRQANLLPDETMQVRLPTEWEWQWLAQNGEETRAYPWGDWQEGYANTSEAGMNRTTAVGMYPHGAAECAALDMAGNLWEWCANNYDEPEIIDATNTSSKVLRGGSFSYNRNLARASYRNNYNPHSASSIYGVRLVVAPILRL